MHVQPLLANHPRRVKSFIISLSHFVLNPDDLWAFVGALVDYPHKVMEIAMVHLLTVLLSH